jgi:hypothetical protein
MVGRGVPIRRFLKMDPFMPTARYFRDLAAMYREIARQASDPHAADSMSAIATRHQERADELEQWSEPFARSPIVPT